MLNFCVFIRIFVFTTNHHLKFFCLAKLQGKLVTVYVKANSLIFLFQYLTVALIKLCFTLQCRASPFQRHSDGTAESDFRQGLCHEISIRKYTERNFQRKMKFSFFFIFYSVLHQMKPNLA